MGKLDDISRIIAKLDRQKASLSSTVKSVPIYQFAEPAESATLVDASGLETFLITDLYWDSPGAHWDGTRLWG